MDEILLQGLDGDHQSQIQVMQYFEQLTSSADGWKLCAEAFTSTAYQGNDPVRFFCLRVCEHVLKTRYQNADPIEQGNMHRFLLASLHLMSQEPRQDKSYMRNKLAQIISLAFVADYPARWPSFFETFYEVLSRGPLAVDMYLRVLKAIDQEVVDREIVHTPAESQRNSAIKDSMRENCVRQLADSWLYILKEYEESQPEIACLCLEVVGKYVAWIDISLVANDHFVPVLLRFLTLPLLRESACDCIYEILSKGMDPVAKTELVESFFSVLDNTGILNPPEEEEGDFLAKLSKLICGVGLALITSLQKLSKAGDCAAIEKTQAALGTKIPYLLRFLGDEDDDVSQAASEFAQEYICLLKTRVPLLPPQRKHIEGLLYTVVKKMKYDESYNFEHEGEDEAMFMEYRKQIKVIFNNIAQLDPELVLLTVHNIVTQTLPQWESANFRDIEMAITLLYSVAEAVPSSHGQHFSGNPTKVSVLQDMMRLLVSSRVSCQGHLIVQLQFFETVVRYDKFFMCEPQHIPDVLVAFLDKRGLRHPSVKVRSRCSYLFSRFVKSLKAHLQPYLNDVFTQLQDLLILNGPSDTTTNGQHLLLSDNDQLFLYETASMLVVSSILPPEKKQELMTSLLAPIASKFEELLSCLSAATDEKQQTAYGNCIYNALSLASRASKGFSGSQTMKQSGCVPAFTNLLQLFGLALDTPVQRSHVQAGVRQFLHRMVVCLDAEILPFIPPLMTRLLKHPDVRELYEFLPLLNQLIMKFKGAIVPFLSEVLMPLVTTIFRVLMSPTDERDQVAASERKLLQRGYFLFLSTIVSSECISVFKTLDVQSVDQVFTSIVQGAVELQDPQSQKHCFVILRKLTETWGGESDGMTGFSTFMYKRIVPACIMAPLSPAFDLKDGQTSLVLGECASCLKAILEKRGAELVTYLQTDYLRTLNMSALLAEEFCQALQRDEKTFRKYLKTFFEKVKS